MPVDASIPLAAGQIQGPDPRQMMSLLELAHTMRQRRQAENAQNALRSIFANPSNLDASGNPTPDAMRGVMAIDPATGMQLRSQATTAAMHQSTIEKNRAQQQGAELDQRLKKEKYIQDTVREPSLLAYQQAKDRGMTDSAAHDLAQAEYSKGLDTAKGSGIFGEEEQAQFAPGFDLQRVQSRSQTLKDYTTAQEKKKADDLAAKREAETERHDRTNEHEASVRDSIAEKRLEHLEENASGNGKAPPGYRWSKDKPGELEVIPGGPAARKEGAGLTVADKMNPVMLATVRLDVTEGRKALDFMKTKALDKGSAFYADEHGSSAGARLLKKVFTPEDQQEFDVYANKLGQAIASAQSMGRGQISEAKIREAQKSIPVEGDSKKVRDVKIEQLGLFFKYVDDVLKTPIKPGARGASDEAAERQDAADFSHLWE